MASDLSVDLDALADPEFNVIDWLNSVLHPSHTIENTTDLTAKVQQASHDTSRHISKISDGMIKSMPRIAYDIRSLSDQARATKQIINGLEKNMKKDVPMSLEQLHQLHLVKTRMDACRAALRDIESQHLAHSTSDVSEKS